MNTVKLDDLESLARFYSEEDFRNEARLNAGTATTLHGVTIQSPPDADGAFTLTRTKRQTGESMDDAGSTFLCPLADEMVMDAPERRAETDGGVDPRPANRSDAYRDFLAEIMEAARKAGEGRGVAGGDARLRGFHGG